jgi:hypothetical protein
MTRMAAALLVLAVAVSGCNSAADLTGLATGGAAGAATANPAVGYAVGIGARAAADYLFQYIARVRQHAEQDAIASAAGGLAFGEAADWHIHHDIPIGNEGGRVMVARDIDTSIATCREIAFSIHDDPPAPEAWFTTTICRDGKTWQWAQAEPAVERWGFLQ